MFAPERTNAESNDKSNLDVAQHIIISFATQNIRFVLSRHPAGEGKIQSTTLERARVS